MGENIFIFIFTIVSSLVLINSAIALNPTSKAGFTLRMIHKDSKESPLYPGDHLTEEDRFQRLVQQSKDRSRYIESQILRQSNATSSINPDVDIPVVYEGSMWYVTDIGVGTFIENGIQTFKHYYLMIDSGSDLTWLQCDGARPSFRQDTPLYPYQLSITYQPILCRNQQDCMPGSACNANGHCSYYQKYASGASTSGVLARERFTMHSNHYYSGIESIPLYMGCGFNQENFDHNFGRNHLDHKPDLISGILGLGTGPMSFINLLGAAGEGKFDHCLEKFDHSFSHGLITYLRFGEDATFREGQEVHTTPMVVPAFPTPLYYLKLEDISVGDKRVGFDSQSFELTESGEGGFIIDSGTPWSTMYRNHFERVAELVKDYFRDHHAIEPIESGVGSLPLCYHVPPEWDHPLAADYPSITLHFQGANFVVSGIGSAFVFLQNPPPHNLSVCLAISISENSSPAFLMGAMQQTNKRILYNLMDRSLSFADQDCGHDI